MPQRWVSQTWWRSWRIDDGCVGQGVDDFDAAFGAVGEFLESVVVSGVGLFNWSAFSGLQWGPAWADRAKAVDLLGGFGWLGSRGWHSDGL